MDKRRLMAILGLVIGTFLIFPAMTTSAHDDEYDCPSGTDFSYKVEPLSGKTFTVPTPPTGWTVLAVILKVGGPGGGTHILFTPVTAGQVLSVANQQYDISHAHVCKDKIRDTTTTSTSTTTTTTTLPEQTTTTTTTLPEETTTTTTTVPEETTTTTVAETTTTTIADTTTTTVPDETTTTTVPDETTTTTVPDETTTTTTDPGETTTTVAETTTTVAGVVATTTTVATCLDASGTPQTDLSLCALPSTGGETDLIPIGLGLLAVGGIMIMLARRPVTP